MSTKKPAPSPAPILDKAALETAIANINRRVKDLKSFDVSGIQERWDPRLEGLGQKVNSTLADIFGAGTAEYLQHAIGSLGAQESMLGDRYSLQEVQEGVLEDINRTVGKLGALRKSLTLRLEAGPVAVPVPAPVPGPEAAPAEPPPPPSPAPEPVPAPKPPDLVPESVPAPEPAAAPEALPPPPPAPAPAPAPTPVPPVPPVLAVPARAPTPSLTPTVTPTMTPTPAVAKALAPTPAPRPSTHPAPNPGARILIVGEDAAGLEEVEQLMEGLGLEPVLLPAASGSEPSLIERLEAQADAGFAVVLLRPADVGDAVPTGLPSGKALQEIVLALGFCIGTLGRKRICLLHPGNWTLPPGAGDVNRHAMDNAGLWRLLLAREMRQAGLDVDMNRAV